MTRKANKLKKKVKNIHIIGPQGSGKDTQSEMLSKKRKVPFIVMGELFRQEVRRKTPAGKRIDELMKKGRLVPDKLTFRLLKKRLSRKDARSGYILNGFPRNYNQLKAADKITRIDLLMELRISDREALKRLSGRLTCPKCGATYHVIYNPPKNDKVCNQCGTRLIKRKDDQVQAIKKRLKIYHQETEPLFEYYKKKGIYIKINGEQMIPEVFKEILHKIKKFKK